MTKEKLSILKKTGYIVFIVGILCEIIYIYSDIFVWMKTAWFTYPPDRFGIYIPLLFIFIFLYRLLKNPDIKLDGNMYGIFLVIGGISIFLIGIFADIHVIKAASLIIICYGFVLYLMGYEWAKKMLFSFSFLFLMLPTTSSFIESIFSVPLRNLTADISCKILNSTGSPCNTINCVLYMYDSELPVQYFRESISSLMVHLIITYIAAEIFFIKNYSKFLFVILLWAPCVIFAHSIIYMIMGWSYASGDINQSEIIWGCRKWLPATIHILFLVVTWILIKKIMWRKNNESK
jgi:hypothetical protein